MPKIDSQKRLVLPLDLRLRCSGYNERTEIAFYYEDNKIFLTHSSDEKLSQKAILCIRQLDDKGRFFLSNDMLEFLDAKVGDTVFIALYPGKNEFCMFRK